MNRKIKQNLTVPNFLSVIRILMIPVIALFYAAGQYISAVVLVAISGLTDVVDGYIARKFNCVSPLGKLLDPVADKATVLVLLVMVMMQHVQLLFLFCFVFVKDAFLVTGTLVLFRKKSRPPQAKFFGKASTFTTYLSISVAILSDVFVSCGISPVPDAVLWGLCGIACVFVTCALAQYIVLYCAIKRGKYDLSTENFVNSANNQ